jgi:hypothetical protein
VYVSVPLLVSLFLSLSLSLSLSVSVDVGKSSLVFALAPTSPTSGSSHPPVCLCANRFASQFWCVGEFGCAFASSASSSSTSHAEANENAPISGREERVEDPLSRTSPQTLSRWSGHFEWTERVHQLKTAVFGIAK